ncbi:hypothetical protein EDB80DRAFT_892083 [Ilyonectria destructans]|nr:hypothetical protein EDB80DRAFT_892083 [Ilyonectria destructans]
MLNGKMYAIFDPQLIQAVLRKKDASFEPFVTDFAQKTFSLSAHTFAKVKSNSRLVPDFTDDYSVNIRRIMSDLIVDEPTGRQYLVKKGTDIQLPTRFLRGPKDKTPAFIETNRKNKDAYFPFGGGRHLCLEGISCSMRL